MGNNKDEVIGFAMATLAFTNGVCPFCGEALAKDGVLYVADVRKHIEEKDEWEKWKKAIARSNQI